MANIHYQTSQLAAYFAAHRRCWDEFYPSERWIFERIGSSPGGFGRVLDIGCAIGGLGRALEEKFTLASYHGLDINQGAISLAQRQGGLTCPSRFDCADIVEYDSAGDEAFDTVASLSVADWNLETNAIIEACWRRVAPGGRLIISLRLTDREGIRDPETSFQPITSQDGTKPNMGENVEIAPYVVLNGGEALRLFLDLRPAPFEIIAYGYWGMPSKTAVTPYEKLAFAVLSISRGEAENDASETRMECHLPATLFARPLKQD